MTPGDIIVADDDGVVVIAAAIAPGVMDKAAKVAAREQTIRARIQAGETTFDILELGRS